MASHHILYVGRDLILLDFLRELLKPTNDTIVRCPDGRGARLFIESDINYSLLLFDAELSDMTGEELKRFTRMLPHRQQTPVIIKKSGDLDSLIDSIIHHINNQ